MGSLPGGCSGNDAQLLCCRAVSLLGVDRQEAKGKPGLGWRRLEWDLKNSGKIDANDLFVLFAKGLCHRHLLCSVGGTVFSFPVGTSMEKSLNRYKQLLSKS